MTIPNKIPRWATSGLITEPSEGQKDTGWPAGYRVPAEWLNWLQKLTGDWCEAVQLQPLRNMAFTVQPTTIDILTICFLPSTFAWSYGANASSFWGFKYSRTPEDPTTGGGQGWRTGSGSYDVALRASCYIPTYDRLCMVGDSDGSNTQCRTSDNGSTWTARTMPDNIDCYAVAANADGSVVLAGGDRYVYRSLDGGVTWTQIYDHGTFNRVNAILWVDRLSLFILVGTPYGGSDNLILTSPDGVTFTERVDPTPGTGAFAELGDNGNVIFTAGYSDGTYTSAAYSYDGITWYDASKLVATYNVGSITDMVYDEDRGMFIGITSAKSADTGCPNRFCYLRNPLTDNWEFTDLPREELPECLHIADGRMLVGMRDGYILVSNQW